MKVEMIRREIYSFLLAHNFDIGLTLSALPYVINDVLALLLAQPDVSLPIKKEMVKIVNTAAAETMQRAAAVLRQFER